jgi:peptide/nickel transport system ATP-binding protein
MYRGTVIEFGAVHKVFAPPYHPYTEALLFAIAPPDPHQRPEQVILDNMSSSIGDHDQGCVFADRCPRKLGSICDEARPPEAAVEGHRIACHIPRETLVAVQIDFRKV